MTTVTLVRWYSPRKGWAGFSSRVRSPYTDPVWYPVASSRRSLVSVDPLPGYEASAVAGCLGEADPSPGRKAGGGREQSPLDSGSAGGGVVSSSRAAVSGVAASGDGPPGDGPPGGAGAGAGAGAASPSRGSCPCPSPQAGRPAPRAGTGRPRPPAIAAEEEESSPPPPPPPPPPPSQPPPARTVCIPEGTSVAAGYLAGRTE